MRRLFKILCCLFTWQSIVGQVPSYQSLPIGRGVIIGEVRYEGGSAAHTGRDIVSEIAVNVEVQTAGKWTRFGGAAHTDAEGRFRLEGLPDGKYIVFAAFSMSMVRVTGGLQAAGGLCCLRLEHHDQAKP